MSSQNLDNFISARMVKWSACILALALVVVMGVRVLLTITSMLALAIGSVMVGVFLLIFLLAGRVIPPTLCAWIIILVTWSGLSAGGFLTGALDGPVSVSIPLIPLITAVLINYRAAIVMGILSLCSIVAFLLINISGQYHVESLLTDSEADIMRSGWLLFSIFIITMFVSYYGRIDERLKSLLKSQADMDFLTRIANRRKLTETLRDEYFRCRRHGYWLSVLMLDIDHFKKLNDNYGHTAGDDCLVRIADLLQQHCRRASDLVGRYGGEEFLVLLPDTDPQEAGKLAEAIRISIQDLQIPLGSGKHSGFSTATIGCNSVHGTVSMDPEQIIKTADELLYQGKAAGRNVVVSRILKLPEPVSAQARS